MASEKKWIRKWKMSVLNKPELFWGVSMSPNVKIRARWRDEAISGRDPESKPMRRRVLNALKQENRQKSNKKAFENYESLLWQLKCKMEPCRAKSYGERRHMRFEHGHFFFSELRKWKCEFFQSASHFKRPETRGNLWSAQETGLPKVDKRATTTKGGSGGHAPFVV